MTAMARVEIATFPVLQLLKLSARKFVPPERFLRLLSQLTRIIVQTVSAAALVVTL